MELVENINTSFIQLVDIDSIENAGTENVVDIQVQDDESYTLANGLIMHNSASGGILAVRTPAIHGVLPLRGKIMNVNSKKCISAKKSELYDSQALADIMGAIGLVIGKRAKRDELRYGTVMIATDSDADGANIQALINNFLYKYWPELYDPSLPPIIYVMQTPFIILRKGKERRYFYGYEYDQFNPDDWKGWQIRRAKGLGTLEKQDWTHAISDIKAIPIIDDGQLKETLQLLFMHDRVNDRKHWICDGDTDSLESCDEDLD